MLPIDPKATISQPTELSVLFGACHAFLTFPEIYQYQTYPELKNKLYSAGWFPFIQILGKPFNEIFNMIKNDLPLNDIEKLIISSFDETKINSMFNTWVSNQLFKKRESFLKKGIEEFLEKDSISAIHVLYPCIEGILQDLSYDIETQGDAGERLTVACQSFCPKIVTVFMSAFKSTEQVLAGESDNGDQDQSSRIL